jgi:Zn-dependent M16 (insulinase) family peptidase
MPPNAEKALEINREILLETDYSDTAHVQDLLLQLKTVMTRDLLEASHKSAKDIGLAKYSEYYAIDYQLQGYGFYKFLCGVLADFDANKDKLVNAMKAINNALLNPNCWRISYVGGDEFIDGAVDYSKKFLSLMNGNDQSNDFAVSLTDKNSLALYSSSQVQYAALCGMLPEEADDKRGYLLVLQHLLSTDYLWQNIRVLGGAYGCMLSFDNIGTACMVSYRDPNLDETIACFKKIVEYIRSLDLEERDFRQFIIGAMNKLDKPKTPYVDGATAIQLELSGISIEHSIKVRKQIISATLDDIKALAPIFEQFLESATEVVIGNEQTIKSSSIKFDEVKPLI